jgi:acyl-coenzyme A synthetase/AMP-(fatty) acid ligase
LPIFERLVQHAREDRVAIVDYSVSPSGHAQYSYSRLLEDVTHLRDALSCSLRTPDLKGERIAFLVESGYNYVVTIMSVWALGGFAVPLCTTHPVHEMLYTVTDSDASVILATPLFETKVTELVALAEADTGIKRALYILAMYAPGLSGHIPKLVESPIACPTRHALMIYTSGTTGKPKVRTLLARSYLRASFPLTKPSRHRSSHLSNTGKLHPATE